MGTIIYETYLILDNVAQQRSFSENFQWRGNIENKMPPPPPPFVFAFYDANLV